jgi:hypothetical protein
MLDNNIINFKVHGYASDVSTTPSLVYACPFVNDEVEGTFIEDNID